MKLEIELPETYAERLETVEEVDPTIREQIEIEVLPEVLRLISDAHRQVNEQDPPVAEGADAPREPSERSDSE